MKKGIITPLLFLLFISAFSQKLTYEVVGKNSPLTKKEKLVMAQSMSDLIPNYPSGWITAYVSTEITVTSNGKTLKASGSDAFLSAKQKKLLASADLGTEVMVKINYKTRNSVTDALELSTMRYSTTAVPEVEAQYPSGSEQMTQYLNETAISKIAETAANKYTFVKTSVRFTVNETGEIANAQIIFNPSSEPRVGEILLEAIHNMPKWKPAENSKGEKVKQEFELTVAGRDPGGC